MNFSHLARAILRGSISPAEKACLQYSRSQNCSPSSAFRSLMTSASLPRTRIFSRVSWFKPRAYSASFVKLQASWRRRHQSEMGESAAMRDGGGALRRWGWRLGDSGGSGEHWGGEWGCREGRGCGEGAGQGRTCAHESPQHLGCRRTGRCLRPRGAQTPHSAPPPPTGSPASPSQMVQASSRRLTAQVYLRVRCQLESHPCSPPPLRAHAALARRRPRRQSSAAHPCARTNLGASGGCQLGRGGGC